MHQSPHEHATPSATDLDYMRELFGRGLALQAYAAAQRFGPLHTWSGAAARVLAGRMAWTLGAPRLCGWLHIRGWREDRGDPDACYYFARHLLERRGPLATWYFLRRIGELATAPARVHSDWLAFHACVLGRVRDFEAAEAWLARAEQASPDQPWTCIERSALLEGEDRYEEALASARRALELRPWYRPGVQVVAHLLQLLGCDHEALDLLTEADQHLESGPLALQRAVLQTELGRPHDARQSYARFRELSPLLEKDFGKWILARQSDVVYYCGDLAEAASIAKQVDDPFYTQLADRLADPAGEGRRALLDVGFVRQHHQTCVPATLAALSRFWKMPAEHLDVAADICYDGTPDHRERFWAEQHGWTTREFAVSWDSALALLDRGIPFTLTTIEPTNAHLQAVIGYDSRRQTLLVRDPYLRNFSEFIAETMLERYRSTGPRGMALVPREQAHLLDGLNLPDEELYDQLYRLQRALQVHERAQAAEACTALQAQAPGHRLTLLARYILARYDLDHAAFLAAVEDLLKLFPQDAVFEQAKLASLRQLARREERLTLLRDICGRKEADPVFWRCYAQELAPDAREHATATRLLRRTIRNRPAEAPNFALLANILWDQRRFAEATELYRFATCLDDKDEGLARSYFSAARYLKLDEPTLAFLGRRFERFGTLSSQPARTLYWAYSQFERMPEAFGVLERALQLRPDDGELCLFAADSYACHGKFTEAEQHLAASMGKAPPVLRLRSAAALAGSQGDLQAALDLWQQVLAAEPLAPDANRAVAQLLAETTGRTAALAHLQKACERFPHNCALHQLWIEWLRDDGAAAIEPVVRQLIAIHPADAWACRELALCLSEQAQHDEAFAELETAGGLEPDSASYHSVRAQLCARAGKLAEARAGYREAIRRCADNDFAIAQLINLCDTHAERREALAFIEDELVQQVHYGDGVLAFQVHAAYTLSPEELLAVLQRALDQRPDLWHAWSAVVRQLLSMQRAEAASETACKAVARFPLLPRLWYDLALACEANHDKDGELRALRQALQISPNWGQVLRRLADVHERDGQPEEARKRYEEAVARSPLECANHGGLADLLWRQGEKEAALERVQQALRLEPGYEWGWNALRDWALELERPEVAVAFARELTTRRGGEARSWMMLARMLSRPEDLDERVEALDRALERNPRYFEAHDLKAELLAGASRFDEALAACRPTAWGEAVPVYLRGRAAWVEALSGNVPAAITQTRAALAEDPNYFWAWSNLTDWYRDDPNAVAEYLEAASEMVRLAPLSAPALASRGDARLRAQDRAGAKEDFARAMEMLPDYGYPGRCLFDEQFADGEFDDAARTMEQLRQHCDDEFTQARAVRLAAHRGEQETAATDLRRLAVSPLDEPWPSKSAVLAMREAGWSEQARSILRDALQASTLAFQPGTVLADWAREESANGDYLEVANELVRLGPERAVAYGYRGDARLRAGERAGALEDFRHALELDPKYAFAGYSLFDEHFEAEDFDAAGPVLQHLLGHCGNDEFVLARAVRWSAHQPDQPAALDYLRRLCVHPSSEEWPLNHATAVLDEAGWDDPTDQALGQALDLPNVNPQVAALWIERRCARQDWKCADRLDMLLEHGEVGRRAIYTYVARLGKLKQRRRLRRFIERYRDHLRGNTSLWGVTGYAIIGVEDFHDSTVWLADWADRPDAQPWMLLNYVLALRALAREAEATVVSRHALTLPRDYMSHYHELWLAVEAALAGETDQAAAVMETFDPESADATHRFLYALGTSLVAVQQAEVQDRPAALRGARKRLWEAAQTSAPLGEDHPAVLRTYRRCVLRLGRDCGTRVAKLWMWFRWLEPALPHSV